MNAREEILSRIRTAFDGQTADRTGDQSGGQPSGRPSIAVPRDYHGVAGVGDLATFVERVQDYRATVHQRTDVDAVLAERGIERVVVPHGFPRRLLPSIDTVTEPVSTAMLDEINAVITTCTAAIAQTGTIILDHGPGQGARALTLVPDYHLVVVRPEQVLAGVPDAIAALDPTRPLTWISGPSATSDIELNRVEGVHGPRTLDVLITDDSIT